MASQSRETRQKQLAEWEVRLKKRLAFLGEKGLDDKKIGRDVLVKELKAKIKESQARLRAIDANEARTAGLAAIKAERSAKPQTEEPAPKDEAPAPKKTEKAKVKKAAEPAADAEAKPKKKKKKEESTSSKEA